MEEWQLVWVDFSREWMHLVNRHSPLSLVLASFPAVSSRSALKGIRCMTSVAEHVQRNSLSFRHKCKVAHYHLSFLNLMIGTWYKSLELSTRSTAQDPKNNLPYSFNTPFITTIGGIILMFFFYSCFRWCSNWWTNDDADGSRSASSGWRDDGRTTATANDDTSGTWRDYCCNAP